MTTKRITKAYVKLSKQDMIEAICYWLRNVHGTEPGYVRLICNETDEKQYFAAEVTVDGVRA